MRNYRIIILVIIVASCKSASISTSREAYQEDLSVHRPAISIEDNAEEKAVSDITNNENNIAKPVSNINTEIDSINTLIIRENAEKKYFDGYTIQIYRGNSREEAETARSKARVIFPDMKPTLSYYQPTYRVKMGRFFDRLEATRAYSEIKKEFNTALLLPDELPLPIEENDQ